MRTRFLNTDYFTTSTTGTLNFLNLPPPHLPPSHLPIFNDDLLHFDPLLNVPLQTERLPIDAALSKFLSEAIPQFIDVDFRDFEDTWSPTGNVGARFSEVNRSSILFSSGCSLILKLDFKWKCIDYDVKYENHINRCCTFISVLNSNKRDYTFKFMYFLRALSLLIDD